MRVAFHSSHVAGDYASGRLTIHVLREDEAAAQTVEDELYFEVPPDFHTHNDLVAAALLTLVGSTFADVAFNFPISQRCANILARYYKLNDVGPVDPSLEPRQRGRHVALNFSGGMDSTALWWILTEELGEEFKVITSDYGGGFERERRGVEAFRRDVTCRTNIRFYGYDRAGRFNAAVPLLFADYLDLYGLTSAHAIRHERTDMDSLRDGRKPDFLALEAAYHAGGLDEAHLVRGLHSRALLMILVRSAPHLIEPALHASARPSQEKYFWKAVTLRALHQQLGLAVPPYLHAIQVPSRPRPVTSPGSFFIGGLDLAMRYGVEFALQLAPKLDRFDVSFVHDLSLNFMMRYNPNFIHLIPARYRHRLLGVFHRYGIYPYDERDWHELDLINAFRERIQHRA